MRRVPGCKKEHCRTGREQATSDPFFQTCPRFVGVKNEIHRPGQTGQTQQKAESPEKPLEKNVFTLWVPLMLHKIVLKIQLCDKSRNIVCKLNKEFWSL